MRIISRRPLKEFGKKHPDADQPLKSWHAEVERENWATPQDVKAKYPTASIVGEDRVVFNIRGNRYRLVALVAYRIRLVFVRFVGTHVEYDKIDVKTI